MIAEENQNVFILLNCNYRYNLSYNGIKSEVNCAHGKCSPVNPNINNACVYICGQQKCQH